MCPMMRTEITVYMIHNWISKDESFVGRGGGGVGGEVEDEIDIIFLLASLIIMRRNSTFEYKNY
jgi:hypothetical protein